MNTALDVVSSDLDLISRQLKSEFAELAGSTVLIAGGAGFLGYYLVQSALHANKRNSEAPPIRLVVLDNFVRGVPAWLEALRGDVNLILIEHDITQPLPEAMGAPDYFIHAASIASPIYYRQYPIET